MFSRTLSLVHAQADPGFAAKILHCLTGCLVTVATFVQRLA
jgi:hypothetical protein